MGDNWLGEIPERPEDFDGWREFWAGMTCVLLVAALTIFALVIHA